MIPDFDQVDALLSAGPSTTIELRMAYAARARVLLAAARARLDSQAIMLAAREGEILRVQAGGLP